MPTLKLDPATGDIDISSGGGVMISAQDETQQHIGTRMRFVSNDWFLDPARGLPMFDRILVRNVNQADVYSLYSNQIAQTPGVISVDQIQLTLLPEVRKMRVDAVVTGLDGQFPFASLVSTVTVGDEI